jgi:AcrR family transcriptional regulator
MVRAAIELIAERGLDGLTLQEVGERAGFSRALPAKHFQNKAGLVKAAIAEVRMSGVQGS